MALMAAEARAKAAEVIASAPDKVIDNMTTVISERIAAERRVAELEALLAGWVALKRGAIERREDIPWQALLVEFREPTAAERAYGETLISLLPPPTGENSR